jgi:hypothetical protein
METTQKKTEETFKITGNWEAQSKQLKSKYPQLTDADLKFEPGKENDLISRLQTRLVKNRQEVIDVIKHGQLEKV